MGNNADTFPNGDRSFLLYYASVLLREAKARRGQNVGWMISGAARARREAFAMRPAQDDLFSGPSGRMAGSGPMSPPPIVSSLLHSTTHSLKGRPNHG